MKIIKIILMTTALLFGTALFAQVGIGTQTPDSTAALDIVSDSRGFLYPRMTTEEKLQINDNNPADGLQVYDLDHHCLEVYANGQWICPNADINLCVTTSAVAQYYDLPQFTFTASDNSNKKMNLTANTAVYDPQGWLEINSDGNLVVNRAGTYWVTLYGALRCITLSPSNANLGSNTDSQISFFKQGNDATPEVAGYVDKAGQSPGGQSYTIQGLITAEAGDVFILQCTTLVISPNYKTADFVVNYPYVRLDALQ